MTYTEDIVVDGEKIGEVTYAYGDTELTGLPEVPEKKDYKGRWSYTITGSELEIHPEYFLKGDINFDGITDIGDAILASRYDAGNKILTEDQIFAGDVTGDGILDIGDAVKIARYDAGNITVL
jgi:hypothetical protein